MTPWIVIGSIAAVLAVILCLPVYVYVYFDDDFRFFVRVFGIKIDVSSFGKKKKGKPEKAKKTAAKPEKVKTDGKKLSVKIDGIRRLVLSAKRRLLTKMTFRRFTVHITVADGDPCDTALLYGSVSAAVNLLVAVIHSLIAVDMRDIKVTADYDKSQTEVFADVVLRTFPYKLIAGLFMFAIDYINKPEKEK